MTPSFEYEQVYWERGKVVCGVDEVGRGSFAGPLVMSSDSVLNYQFSIFNFQKTFQSELMIVRN
jgi:ribonuclease HIII